MGRKMEGRFKREGGLKEKGYMYTSDHELLIAKFRLKLKKVGKTARPFRYDPNQIPYDYSGSEKST